MAGWQTSLRIQAGHKLESAKKAGAGSRDIAILQAAYDAARAVELGATGKNEQARGAW